MIFPMSSIRFVLLAVAAALLALSTHVLAVPINVQTRATGLPSVAAPLARMMPNATSHGGAGIIGQTPDPSRNPRPQDAKPGIPICSASEFVQAHNKVRLGLGQPPMRWDKNLAKYSRRFASRRAADCKMIHSYGPYGENIFWGAQAAWSPSQIVDSWVSENQFYDATRNTCAQGQMCGHYTQVVWRDSTRVGCAWVSCLNGGMYAICSYDPPGNYVNESPFSTFDGR
ncbi:pathogenesis-related protein 1A-like [Rhodamnia argentea]|uniref:Pathogenesis-related protein 1A-like n=1 Tax=Rhodamnia argentea TaxID=178133 RepID=A0ABM3HPE2_9MYRT|nr:pathogenesis-related protein 1A-like [Rhodamnia argentea]